MLSSIPIKEKNKSSSVTGTVLFITLIANKKDIAKLTFCSVIKFVIFVVSIKPFMFNLKFRFLSSCETKSAALNPSHLKFSMI